MRGGTNLNRQLPVQHVELEPVGEVIGNPLSLALLEASKPFKGIMIKGRLWIESQDTILIVVVQ